MRTSDPFSTSLVLSVWDKQNAKCVHFNVDVYQTKVNYCVLMMGCRNV